jgi:hypothetical protein
MTMYPYHGNMMIRCAMSVQQRAGINDVQMIEGSSGRLPARLSLKPLIAQFKMREYTLCVNSDKVLE